MKALKVHAVWIVLAVGILFAGAVAADYLIALPKKLPSEMAAHYVGRESCAKCHQSETAAFSGSYHDKAMDLATDQSVLGDFSDVVFEHDGIASRLFRRGDDFVIHTEGPTGQMQDFQVKYVFGVQPLQQYMVELDRDPDASPDQIGRVQVLRISWDTVNKRWFYLRPPDVTEKLQPGDPLHWTGIAQRWQTMCAVCHSTNLKTGFDPAANQYHTTYSEIDVSCEACHGPASLHVRLANSRSLFWDRHHGYGLAKLKGDDPEPQLQSCAPCHSRRAELTGSFQPGNEYCNHFQLETMRAETYHADGQIKDEVYVYGSFIQSKMYHKGIRCTDCHDPHSLKLLHPGNETCTSCHQHSAGKYDVPSHHHHAVGTEGAKCVNCHMPHTTYMQVDPRRDHSIRPPRPDLSVKLGTPNACSQCHVADQISTLPETDRDLVQDKDYADWLSLSKQKGNEAIAAAIKRTDQWCDQACQRWYGAERKTPRHYSEAITALRRGQPDAAGRVLKWIMAKPQDESAVPAIARASMLRELAETGVDLSSAAQSITKLASDADQHPMVRAAAISAVGNTPPDTIRSTLLPLLKDANRLVRIEAARTIMNRDMYRSLSGTEILVLDPVIDRDLMPSLSVAADRAGSHLAAAGLEEQRGNFQEAIQAYETAIRVEPSTTGPRTNYAALLDNLAGQSDTSTQQRQRMVAKAKQLRQQELPLLARDAKLAPDNASLQNRYGLALYLNGDYQQALEQLKRATELAPDVAQFQQAFQLLRQKLQRSQAKPDPSR